MTDTDTNERDDVPLGDPLSEHRGATSTNSIRPTNLDDPDDPITASRDARRPTGNVL